MKKGLRIAGIILGIIIVLLLGAMVALQHPKVQGAIARKAIGKLQEKIDGEISFSELSVTPFDAVVLKDVVILDTRPEALKDTLASVGHLSGQFSLRGLIKGNAFLLRRAKIQDAQFNLVIEKKEDGKGTTNVQEVFRLKSNGEKKDGWGDIMRAGLIDVENFRFTMTIPELAKRGREGCINWGDLDLVANLSANRIRVKDGYVSADVQHLDMLEKSGFHLEEASAKVNVGKGRVDMDGLVLKDASSDLHFNHFNLVGPLSDYNDFIEKVRIEAEIAPSLLSFATVKYFAPGSDFITFTPQLEGNFNGTVSNFTVTDLRFNETLSGVRGTVNGSLKGLPQIFDSTLDFKVKNLIFSMTSLERFLQTFSPDLKLGLDKFAKNELFDFNGRVSGPFTKMDVSGDAVCRAGHADADLQIRNLPGNEKPIEIGGSLGTTNLDIGRIIGNNLVHQLTARANVEATLGKPLRADVLQVNASRLNLKGYDYSGIEFNGTYDGKTFDGNLVSKDPNLKLWMNGGFSNSDVSGNTAYNAHLFLAKADLSALGLDSRETSGITGIVHADFKQTKEEDLIGEITVDNLTLQDDSGLHDLGTVSVSAYSNPQKKRHQFNFNSSFASGSYNGGESILTFIDALQELTVRKELSALTAGNKQTSLANTDYELNLNIKDASVMLAFISPDISIADGSYVRLKATKEGRLYCFARSAKVVYGQNTVRNLVVDVDNLTGGLNGTVKASQIRVGGMDLRSNNCRLQAIDNKININYTFAGGLDQDMRGNLLLDGTVSNEDGNAEISAQVLPSVIIFKGENWMLTSDLITYNPKGLKVKNLNASSQQQTISLDGGYSTVVKDTLRVGLDRFDISILNHFLMDGKLDLVGRASGEATVLSGEKGFSGLVAGLVSEQTFIAGQGAGDISLSSEWNTELKRFDASLHNDYYGQRNFEALGYFTPSTKELEADLEIKSFNLSYFAPILESVFSEFSGLLSGSIRAYGTTDNIHIQSNDTYLSAGRMTVGFTNVPYYVEGPVSVTDEGLFFNDIEVRDGHGGRGNIGGGIMFGGFKDIRLDTHLQLNRIKALNIKPGQNKSFYGDIAATGRVDITGPFNDILLDIEGTTTGEGNLHIPIGSSSSDSADNLLTFVQEEDEDEDADDEEELVAETQVSNGRSSLTVKLRVKATPDVTAFIDIGDNSLAGEGNGTIDIESRSPDNVFTINGDYTLSSGNFHFSAMNLVSRDFELRDGSTIRFNGDIMNSDLDIDGLYTTKTSLSNLLADSTSTRRTVNCGIHITDKLRNPKIELSIDVPDLDPTTQAMVQAALNTDDKMQKQFLYLLIAGTFLPSEESGITTGGSSMLYSNVTSIMAGQLNNIFQKLDIPLDLGFNYQPNDKGNDLLDVALSTQLFNNRVIVNGTIGSRRGTGTTTGGDVTGDLDVEIKVNQDGSLRAKLFSHSADLYTSYLDNSQRNGAGITYQREFRTFGQFVRDVFSTREKRRERQLKEASDTSSVTILIDSTGHSRPLIPTDDDE